MVTDSQDSLDKAIDTMSTEALKATLKSICKASPEAKRLVIDQILIANDSTATGKKRKSDEYLGPYEICSQCGEWFDLTADSDDEDEYYCQWHDGELEVDWDSEIWADHDERCHGPINTNEMRKEHPEGFKWSCCDKDGSAEGCEITPHEPETRRTAG